MRVPPSDRSVRLLVMLAGLAFVQAPGALAQSRDSIQPGASMGADGKIYYPAPTFRDGEAEKLSPPNGLRFVMIWNRTSADKLLTTSRENDKREILDLIDTLPMNQEQATSKISNELPDVQGAHASAERMKKIEVVKGLRAVRDVRLVLHYSRFKQEKGTPASVSAAIVVECYEDSVDVCGDVSPRIIMGPTLGDFSLSPSKLVDEMGRVEAGLNKNVREIQDNEEKMAKLKKDDDSKRQRVKTGLNKFVSGAESNPVPVAPKRQ